MCSRPLPAYGLQCRNSWRLVHLGAEDTGLRHGANVWQILLPDECDDKLAGAVLSGNWIALTQTNLRHSPITPIILKFITQIVL